VRLRALPVVSAAATALPVVSATDQLVMAWRLVVAGASGGCLGFERRSRGRTTKNDSPVGVRTMALVSMGACVFSQAGLCIRGGDSARVAASAATGVGFLGAGVINVRRDGSGVQGLTTAASIWMTAALGVAAGTGLTLFVGLATIVSAVVLKLPHKVVGRRGGVIEDD